MTMNKCSVFLLVASLASVLLADEVITPNDFSGTDSERIEQAIVAAVKAGAYRMTIPAADKSGKAKVWKLDHAIRVPSDFSLLLENCRLELKKGVRDDLIRNAAATADGGKPDKNIEVLGLGPDKSVLTAGAGCGVRLRNVDGFIVSNFEVRNAGAFAVVLDEKCANGRVTNVRLSDARQDGIVASEGCRNAVVERVFGFGRKDIVSLAGCSNVTVRYVWARRADGGDVVRVSPEAKDCAVSNVCNTAVQPAGRRPIPALVPAPRQIAAADGVFYAPSDYVTRDWISFSRDEKLPPEGYRLVVATNGVTVAAADANGELHAMATLRQLGGQRIPYRNTDFYDGGDWGAPLVVPCCEITDWPEYRWRGIMIDDCRHFFGKEAVKRVLDQMSDHKLNVLHWHLTEDQGWRIAIDKYPKLVEYGSVRPASPVNFDCHNQLNGTKYGPFYYTKDDIRELVAYATARGITVVPEIEFPGHIRAALAGYPELSCKGPTLSRVPRCTWGIEDDVLCVGNPAAIKFVEDVLDEVVPLFPGEFFHIGGDECPTKRWKTCPECQAKAKELGLEGPEKLQGWVTAHFTDYLTKKGKRVFGWDEILACDIPTSAGIMSWRGTSGGVKGAEKGHEVVICPQSHCYFNRAAGLKEDPFMARNSREVLSIEKVYGFDPADGVPAEYRKFLLGSQALFWSEAILNMHDLDWKMWPRACAVAEILWTAPAKRDFAAFEKRVAEHRRVLIDSGVNCAPLK